MNPWLAKLKQFDDPALSMVCDDVVPGEDLGFARNLKFVCQATPNGIGLAAPQIGVLKRAIFVWPGRKGDGEFMLNPTITAASEEAVISRDEGCLSYPGFYADVRRRAAVGVSWQTLAWKTESKIFHGIDAIVVQHELDHLNGICFVGDAWREQQARRMARDAALVMN